MAFSSRKPDGTTGSLLRELFDGATYACILLLLATSVLYLRLLQAASLSQFLFSPTQHRFFCFSTQSSVGLTDCAFDALHIVFNKGAFRFKHPKRSHSLFMASLTLGTFVLTVCFSGLILASLIIQVPSKSIDSIEVTAYFINTGWQHYQSQFYTF